MVCEVFQKSRPVAPSEAGTVGGDFQTTVLDKRQLLHNAAPGQDRPPRKANRPRRPTSPGLEGAAGEQGNQKTQRLLSLG